MYFVTFTVIEWLHITLYRARSLIQRSGDFHRLEGRRRENPEGVVVCEEQWRRYGLVGARGRETGANEHNPIQSYKELWQEYKDGKIDYDTFMDKYKDSNNYRPQSPDTNRSRRWEE